MILIFLSLFIIASYVGVMIYKNKSIPSSISDTFYSLEHKGWFGFSMIGTALLLTPSILSYTSESYQFLAFLMCAGLIFVGVSPNFKDGLDRPIHIIATIMAAVCSQIWVILMQPYILLTWIIWFVYMGIKMKKVWNGNLRDSFIKCKPLFWTELILFITVYITLII